MPMDDYLSSQVLPSDDVKRLGTHVDDRIQKIVDDTHVTM